MAVIITLRDNQHQKKGVRDQNEKILFEEFSIFLAFSGWHILRTLKSARKINAALHVEIQQNVIQTIKVAHYNYRLSIDASIRKLQ